MWKFNHAGSLDVEPSHYGKGKHNTIHPVSNSTEARREAEEDKVKEEVGIDTFPWSDQVGDNAKSLIIFRTYRDSSWKNKQVTMETNLV